VIPPNDQFDRRSKPCVAEVAGGQPGPRGSGGADEDERDEDGRTGTGVIWMVTGMCAVEEVSGAAAV
jgi:hypothetical protein